ncbi:MAG: ATP-binding protein [Candidatus Moraniibacteriota bacterium]
MSEETPVPRYSMKIERQIVDKLGLKLYDKVSAVVAELVANSYDADAEKVRVRVPLGKALAVRKGGVIEQKGYEVEVIDDGHGMTPQEASDFYLRVGKDRRLDGRQGDRSRLKSRPVMGRKGIGKLAPFGVCGIIEVRSAGGPRTTKGYEVSHFELNYQGIVDETSDEDDEYHPVPLADDGSFDKTPGTTIRLREFLSRKVPDRETFSRQLAYRFQPLPEFEIIVEDTKDEDPEQPFVLESQHIAVNEGTKITVDTRPLTTPEGETLKVTGWIGMAKESHKNNELAGVRIYARGKIAAITRDFGSPAGFTGEFVARSYLVGEIHAHWLDEGEDLIQTHRQDILWSTERGQAFSEWGQEILKEVAKKGREPRRENVREVFMRVSNLRETAKERYGNLEVEEAAIELGQQIGGFASEDDLGDEDYVNGLREIILAVAPHKLLVDTFRRIEQMAVDGKVDLKELVKLFNTSRIAQLASFGQIVEEKVRAIDLLDSLIKEDGADESKYQEILEDAPWLIDPRWVPVTANQALNTFRTEFETWYKREYGEEVITTTEIEHGNKRPDFIFLNLDHHIVVVEIKPPKHVFADEDYTRLERYHDALTAFLTANPRFVSDCFPKGLKIILVRDGEKLSSTQSKALELLRKNGLETYTWSELLMQTKRMHQQYIDARA